MNEISVFNSVPTMSHRQIAEFLNSTGEPIITATGELVFTERKDDGRPKVRLDNVKRTIERLAESGALTFTPMEGTPLVNGVKIIGQH